MRSEVIFAYAGKYKGTPWERKVNKMSDNQVLSIYLNLKKRGKIK
jgi:hypothetical protein